MTATARKKMHIFSLSCKYHTGYSIQLFSSLFGGGGNVCVAESCISLVISLGDFAELKARWLRASLEK